MVQLEISEAKLQLTELIDRARSGEEIVLSDGGKPVVKLGPAEIPKVESVPDWKAAMMQAAGIWKDRDDIPELMAELRREWNRVEPPDEPL